MRWPWATVPPEARSRSSVDVEDGDAVAIAGVDEHPAAAAIDPLHGSRNRGEDRLPGGVALDPGPVERVLVLGKAAPVRVGAGVVPLHHLPLTTRHRPGNPGALTPGRFRVGSGDVGGGAAVGTGAGTSPDGVFAAGAVAGAATAAPSPSSSSRDPTGGAVAGHRHETILRWTVDREGRARGKHRQDGGVDAGSRSQVRLGRGRAGRSRQWDSDRLSGSGDWIR